MLDVWKNSFLKEWERQGYASIDRTFMKLLHMSQSYYDYVEKWVQKWNDEHKITPLKYFEEDGYEFDQSTSSPHNYHHSSDQRTIKLSDGNLSGDVIIHRIDVNTKDKDITVWIDVDFDTIVDDGSTFDELYHPDEYGDDDFFRVISEYRDDFLWFTAKHIGKNYTDKMGYHLEIEFI